MEIETNQKNVNLGQRKFKLKIVKLKMYLKLRYNRRIIDKEIGLKTHDEIRNILSFSPTIILVQYNTLHYTIQYKTQ